jgi:type I restriction enzyme S subunit
MKWEFVKLGEVFKVTSGGTPNRKKEHYFQSGTIPWVKTGDLKGKYAKMPPESITQEALKNSSAKVFPENTVLLAMYGATIGACSILSFEAATNQACAALLPSAKCDSDYLYYYLLSIRDDLIKKGVGGAQPNISGGIIKDIKIPLPPLVTQKEIADILDAADAYRQKTKQLLAKYDELAQSIFLEMFGDPVTNPKGWNYVRLHELIDTKRGISYGVVQRGEHEDDGVPLIRIRDLIEGSFNVNSLVRTNKTNSDKYKRTILKGGEFLISIRGTVGKISIAPEHSMGWNITREVAIIPFVKDIEKGFLLHFLRSQGAQSKILGDVKGVAQSGINLKDLRDLLIFSPPKSTQLKFVKIVQEISTQRVQVVEALEKAEDLFNSLLQKAFKGEMK